MRLLFFCKNNIVLNSNKKEKTTFSLNLNNITLEKLTNSDQLCYVIPLDQSKKTHQDEYFTKINNGNKSVILLCLRHLVQIANVAFGQNNNY
jgi:hypothetical protein